MCKIDMDHYPRDAGTFELMLHELRASFKGILNILFHAATCKNSEIKFVTYTEIAGLRVQKQAS